MGSGSSVSRMRLRQFELILLRATHTAGSPGELPLLVLILWVRRPPPAPPSFWQPALRDPGQRATPMSRTYLLGCADTHLGCWCVELGLWGPQSLMEVPQGSLAHSQGDGSP